jgi:hypothetical protein
MIIFKENLGIEVSIRNEIQFQFPIQLYWYISRKACRHTYVTRDSYRGQKRDEANIFLNYNKITT